MTEHVKWRHIVAPYLTGNGIELATQGDPIAPHSIQFELLENDFAIYNSGHALYGPVQWRSNNAIYNLPFKDHTLDYVASSHLIEDFLDWAPLLREWIRVLKQGGKLVICLPDKERWNDAIVRGQPPNCAHKHESHVGELSGYTSALGIRPLVDAFTDTPPGDYNILFVGEKL